MAGQVAAWPPAPAEVVLTVADVHVWCVFLNRTAAGLEALLPTLSPEERARANRFYFIRDKNRFIAGHGTLRAILGRYLNVAPAKLAFTLGRQGKPELAATFAASRLHFNLSHSGDIALCAVAYDRVIGVDVEQIRTVVDATQIAKRFFSPWENEAFAAVPDAQKSQAFFNCWTRKEAYIKAIGEGLSCPLDAFDVSLAPGEPARILRIRGSETVAARWTLYPLLPAAGYVGAVAIKGGNNQLSCWQWP